MVPQQKQAELTQTERLRQQPTYTPRVDILETKNELLLYADVPGVEPGGVDISFERGELRIHGKCQPRQDKVNFYLSEYGTGDYYRSFTIGEAIDVNNISAELNDGVLTLHLPKSEAVKPKRIEVKNGLK
jgi:HSP20 family molecular chaperone IbpA